MRDMQGYNASEKGRRRRAAYRERHRERIRVADAARLVRKRAENRAWLDAYKVEKGCADCGYNAHPRALDFDHIGTDKIADVGWLVHAVVSWTRILAEIAKCEVVCANCHRVRTADREDAIRSALSVVPNETGAPMAPDDSTPDQGSESDTEVKVEGATPATPDVEVHQHSNDASNPADSDSADVGEKGSEDEAPSDAERDGGSD